MTRSWHPVIHGRPWATKAHRIDNLRLTGAFAPIRPPAKIRQSVLYSGTTLTLGFSSDGFPQKNNLKYVFLVGSSLGKESLTRMSVTSSQRPMPDADLAAALDGSACLGAWTHDFSADRFRVAASLACLLGLAPEEAGGASLVRVLSGIHAEDRLRIENLLDAACTTGAPFEAEFRTWAGGRGSRWLRLMGRTEIDGGHRAVRARGLAFDLTDGRRGRGTPVQQAQWQVNQLADHVIAMKGLISTSSNPSLARLVDRMAIEIGFELARCLQRTSSNAH